MAEKLNKDAVYRSAKPKDKDYTINGGGLVLLVKTSGVKTWRFIYRYQGKQNRLGLGAYPATSLEKVRQEADRVRETDPSQERKQTKQAAKTEGDNEQRKAYR